MEVSFAEQNRITNDNLKKLTEVSSSIYEERICEIAILAQGALRYVKQLMDSDMSFADAITAIREEGELFSDVSDIDAAQSTKEGVLAFARELSYHDKILFSQFLCDAFRGSGIPLDESDLLPADKVGERFTYARNVLSDEAYDVFSQEFDDPRIVYADSTKQALRSVADGECDYCIVPFEEKGGARVLGIYAMIASLDLKVASVTPVFGPDGDADVKYALVGREFLRLEKQEGDDVYLEVLIPSDSAVSVSELLAAAERVGLSVHRIGGLEYESDSDRISAVYIAFKSLGDEDIPLIAFLEMFVDDYSAIGLYKNIE